jgi:hypothetical protein
MRGRTTSRRDPRRRRCGESLEHGDLGSDRELEAGQCCLGGGVIRVLEVLGAKGAYNRGPVAGR